MSHERFWNKIESQSFERIGKRKSKAIADSVCESKLTVQQANEARTIAGFARREQALMEAK
jgi:hypothetical protein